MMRLHGEVSTVKVMHQAMHLVQRAFYEKKKHVSNSPVDKIVSIFPGHWVNASGTLL